MLPRIDVRPGGLRPGPAGLSPDTPAGRESLKGDLPVARLPKLRLLKHVGGDETTMPPKLPALDRRPSQEREDILSMETHQQRGRGLLRPLRGSQEPRSLPRSPSPVQQRIGSHRREIAKIGPQGWHPQAPKEESPEEDVDLVRIRARERVRDHRRQRRQKAHEDDERQKAEEQERLERQKVALPQIEVSRREHAIKAAERHRRERADEELVALSREEEHSAKRERMRKYQTPHTRRELQQKHSAVTSRINSREASCEPIVESKMHRSKQHPTDAGHEEVERRQRRAARAPSQEERSVDQRGRRHRTTRHSRVREEQLDLLASLAPPALLVQAAAAPEADVDLEPAVLKADDDAVLVPANAETSASGHEVSTVMPSMEATNKGGYLQAPDMVPPAPVVEMPLAVIEAAPDASALQPSEEISAVNVPQDMDLKTLQAEDRMKLETLEHWSAFAARALDEAKEVNLGLGTGASDEFEEKVQEFSEIERAVNEIVSFIQQTLDSVEDCPWDETRVKLCQESMKLKLEELSSILRDLGRPPSNDDVTEAGV